MRSSCTLQTDVFCNMTGELSFLTKVHWCSGISTLECLSPSQNCSKSILVVLQHGRSWQLSVMARNTMASPSGLWAILTKIWPNSLGTIYVRAPTTFFFFFPGIASCRKFMFMVQCPPKDIMFSCKSMEHLDMINICLSNRMSPNIEGIGGTATSEPEILRNHPL